MEITTLTLNLPKLFKMMNNKNPQQLNISSLK